MTEGMLKTMVCMKARGNLCAVSLSANLSHACLKATVGLDVMIRADVHVKVNLMCSHQVPVLFSDG